MADAYYEQAFEHEPFTVVAAGMLLFAVGPADQPWPPLELPNLNEAKQAPHTRKRR